MAVGFGTPFGIAEVYLDGENDEYKLFGYACTVTPRSLRTLYARNRSKVSGDFWEVAVLVQHCTFKRMMAKEPHGSALYITNIPECFPLNQCRQVSQLFGTWPASMRNLLNIYQAISKVSSSEAPDLPLTATAWCAGDGADSYESLLCVFGPSENSAIIDLKRLERRSSKNAEESSWHLCDIASWDAPCPTPDLVCDKVLDAHYFGGERVACLVLAGGDIVVIQEEPRGGQDKIEVVGSFDAVIRAAAWSPDEEMLAISTRGETFILMTRDFEVLANLVLSPDDLQVSKHVSVGWGKSETQFKGKRAKALQDPTIPEGVDEGRLSPFDKGKVRISWRGDGAYVAVSSIEASKRRLVRVYSRDGVLGSVSEPVDGLEGALSWRPAGNLITGIQRSQGRVEVVFFERNGLRHGQFDLRLAPEEMVTWASDIELKWNGDSTVLAVCFTDRVQFWTMGNYHYYLKQEFRLPTFGDESTVATLSWHPEVPLQLAISTGGSHSTSRG
ncbi:MAG: hypothetical protein M1840_002323 [Geoglossum simile]|nr:MAG: hypothetical protein M1840_002323 [Geoglossum simile]